MLKFTQNLAKCLRIPVATSILSEYPLQSVTRLSHLHCTKLAHATKPTTIQTKKSPTHQSRTSYELRVESPYRKPGPRRYGYDQVRYTGGLLPRPTTNVPYKSMPQYKPKDRWATKKALFGQNDYIDILGDGSVHPVDLMRAPPWLMGFRGNEFQRVTRQVRFEGLKYQYLYPTRLHNIKKRAFFLYKKYNIHRSKKH